MIGNLSASRPNSLLISNYQRNTSFERSGTHINEAPQRNQNRRIQQAFIDVTAGEKTQKESNQSREQKLSYEDIKEMFKSRTVLYKMMETMGATGTEYSVTGHYLDTYI